MPRISSVIAAHRCEPGSLSHQSPRNHILPNLTLSEFPRNASDSNRHWEDLDFVYILYTVHDPNVFRATEYNNQKQAIGHACKCQKKLSTGFFSEGKVSSSSLPLQRFLRKLLEIQLTHSDLCVCRMWIMIDLPICPFSQMPQTKGESSTNIPYL